MKFTEEKLKQYASPLSETENQKCLRAIREIRDALKDLGYSTASDSIDPIEADTYAYSTILKRANTNEEIQIFIQGSYANNTCVRGDSDVDIAIMRKDKYEYAFMKSFSVGSVSHKADAKVFKDTVERVLRKHFPFEITRKNKSIKVDGNTCRKQADTVPCFSIRYYRDWEQNDHVNYLEGITIYPDDGDVIFNFPKQHIANGKKKNVATNHYYKKMVRIIKKMRYLMEDMYISSAKDVSSFGLESLLWNLPNDLFTKYTFYYGFAFGEIVKYLDEHKYMLSLYKEANGIKPLCPTADDINRYKKFIDDLRSFYHYEL